MRCALLLTLALFTGFASGCSKSEEAAPEAKAPVAPPDSAVRDFLEAIRTGDDKKAEAMLTDLARQKTAQMDLMVAPPGSPTASFTLGEMEVIDDQVAHVSSIWTDTGDDGQPQRNEFVWALRLEPQGWRIAGVAVALFPNQPPLLLDFEDPADMMRKQQMAEAEMQRQMNPQAGGSQTVQAGGPAAAAQSSNTNPVQPAGATAPGPFQNDPNAPFNPAATTTPGTGSTAAPGNLPPASPYSPPAPGGVPGTIPTVGPATPGAPVPLQAGQPQPLQPSPR